MAPSPLSSVLHRREPERELPPAAVVDIGDDLIDPKAEDGAVVIELEDGAVIVDLDPASAKKKAKSDKFEANLAEEIEDFELARIADELLLGITADDDSRQDWLSTHAAGIKLLGLVIEDNTGSSADSSAPLEGMSTARDPMLLEAVLSFQATARGELLPAAGPVKVRDDRPTKPANEPGIGHNGGPALDGAPPPMPGNPMAGAGMPPAPPAPPPQPSMVPGVPMPVPGQPEKSDRDELADALEKDFNHYLTVTAPEYVPDTDRMLFSVGFGGQGVKKVYNCPLRRRPVSESVAMEDFIVSNALTDLSNASRITHRIKMRPSVLKRMQLIGAYRDIDLLQPTQGADVNAVDQAKAETVGVAAQPQDPKDADYELYECYCELQIDDDLIPAKFKGKGLPLPYKITIEKESQTVLQVRRNWRESDPECMAKEFFVEFPYVKAFGFYGIGLLHIVGNLAKALTAMMRISIDNGMFSNFPGFLYAKGAGRQLQNQFRVAPGTGVGLDVGLAKLSDAVMALPYKEFSQAWAMFQEQMRALGQRVAGTANINVGEGKQDAPVGTTLALIEQATKPTGAVLKRLHTAQSKELQLLRERFLDDPEAFWRFNRRPTVAWQKEQFVKALEDFDLTPVSDPNNPTKMHRAAKAAMLQQIQTGSPGLLDPRKVFKRQAHDFEIEDPDDLLAPPMPPQAPPVDQGKIAMAEAKKIGDQLRAKTEIDKAALGKETAMIERQARIEQLEKQIQLEDLRGEQRRDLEELRQAGRLAVAAEQSEQKDLHHQEKIAHDREQLDADRKHRESVARETHKNKIDIVKAKPKPAPKGKTK